MASQFDGVCGDVIAIGCGFIFIISVKIFLSSLNSQVSLAFDDPSNSRRVMNFKIVTACL
jgi:hypothetical protein